MGEMQMIKDGVSTTIHRDGSITREIVDKCDNCGEYRSKQGGLTITVVGGEAVIWLCELCRG
jgi:hypothetical protein